MFQYLNLIYYNPNRSTVQQIAFWNKYLLSMCSIVQPHCTLKINFVGLKHKKSHVICFIAASVHYLLPPSSLQLLYGLHLSNQARAALHFILFFYTGPIHRQRITSILLRLSSSTSQFSSRSRKFDIKMLEPNINILPKQYRK